MILSELLNQTQKKLEESGIETFKLDSEILISTVLEIERYKLVVDGNSTVSDIDLKKISRFINRRIKKEPIAYILGEKEFYSLDFIVNKNVLIPRPETELLVDMAIYYAQMNSSVLDIGTGSGAISIALSYNRPDLQIIASDISEKALAVAKKNAKEILTGKKIKFIQGDLFESVKENKFDLIVSNPPYVDPQLKDELQIDLTYEPDLALYSQKNGREIIEKIINEASSFLNKNSVMLMEIGSDQKDFIKEIGKAVGFSVSVLNDYSGLPRVGVFKN